MPTEQTQVQGFPSLIYHHVLQEDEDSDMCSLAQTPGRIETCNTDTNVQCMKHMPVYYGTIMEEEDKLFSSSASSLYMCNSHTHCIYPPHHTYMYIPLDLHPDTPCLPVSASDEFYELVGNVMFAYVDNYNVNILQLWSYMKTPVCTGAF